MSFVKYAIQFYDCKVFKSIYPSLHWLFQTVAHRDIDTVVVCLTNKLNFRKALIHAFGLPFT